jgi:hypothetical protein
VCAPALLAVKRRGDLVAAAIGWLQLLVRVDSARLNRFSRWVIAQRVRGRYSRLARNGSCSQKFYGRRDRRRGLAAYPLGMSGTVNRVREACAMGAFIGKTCYRLPQCLLCYAAAYAGLSTSS